MIQQLPDYISIVFILTTFATLFLFYLSVTRSTIDHSTSKAKYIVISIVLWLIFQAVLSWTGFYLNTTSYPPRLIVAVIPPLLIILALFITAEGKLFIDHMSLSYSTYIHSVRIPVELVLYWLYLNKAVPELMTFAGRNFDIIAGITAPLIAFFGVFRQKLGKRYLLIWNYICLVLLFNIVINAVLSAPFPFQKFAFNQPNIAILNFPFIWLPAFIVPTVLFSHLVSIRILRKAQ